MNMEEWFRSACADSSSGCVPMCFMWSLPISETFGKFEKVLHNNLGGEDVHEKDDAGRYLYSPSTLCAIDDLLTSVGLTNVGYSYADPQPHLFFEVYHYAEGSSHNEASAGHHSGEVYKLEEAPDGYVMDVPNRVSGGGATCECDEYFNNYEDERAEALANATAAMENAVFVAYGEYLSASDDMAVAYECLTNVFTYINGNRKFISKLQDTSEGHVERAAEYSEWVLNDQCPDLMRDAKTAGDTAKAEGERAAETCVEGEAYYWDKRAEEYVECAGFMSGSSYYQYWSCKEGERHDYCGWNKMTAAELSEYNMMNSFESFETSLVDHPYSQETCEEEMVILMEEYVEEQNDAELRSYATAMDKTATIEAEIEAARCSAGQISVPMSKDYKSFRNTVETICILNPAGLEDKYDKLIQDSLAEASAKKAEIASKSSEEKAECTPQEVYDFFTTSWYCYNKAMQMDGQEPTSGPFTGPAVRAAYDKLVAGDGYTKPVDPATKQVASCLSGSDWKGEILSDF